LLLAKFGTKYDARFEEFAALVVKEIFQNRQVRRSVNTNVSDLLTAAIFRA
jgi:hypothetical protein